MLHPCCMRVFYALLGSSLYTHRGTVLQTVSVLSCAQGVALQGASFNEPKHQVWKGGSSTAVFHQHRCAKPGVGHMLLPGCNSSTPTRLAGCTPHGRAGNRSKLTTAACNSSIPYQIKCIDIKASVTWGLGLKILHLCWVYHPEKVMIDYT